MFDPVSQRAFLRLYPEPTPPRLDDLTVRDLVLAIDCVTAVCDETDPQARKVVAALEAQLMRARAAAAGEAV